MTRITDRWLEDPATKAVTDMLTKAGHEAFFVGGCVRDAILGKAVTDIDIATGALPEEVIRLAGDAGLKAIPTGVEHGTVTVVSGNVPHEITTYRRDVATDGRRAVVAFSKSMRDDAKRRDFTMNALYAGPDGWVIDPLGEGLKDLKARRVRFIGEPEDRIREDYLRILRFFRFQARFGLPHDGFDPEALAAIAGNVEGIETLSAERIGAEMRKILSVRDPSPALAVMRQTGVLLQVLPGAVTRSVPLLVHAEGLMRLAPEPMTRLAALGGEEADTRLRLSRKEQAQLQMLREEAVSTHSAAELGYRHGADDAWQILVLRVALLEMPFDTESLEEMRAQAYFGSGQAFPVTARDLMPRYQGAELGRRLKELEARWIAADFSLDREDLLGES